MQKRSIIEMEYHELEDLIFKTYGHKYEYVAQEELSNDSCKDFPNYKKEPLDGLSQEDLDSFKLTGKMENWQTHILIQDMVNNGVLEEGNYLISVSW